MQRLLLLGGICALLAVVTPACGAGAADDGAKTSAEDAATDDAAADGAAPPDSNAAGGAGTDGDVGAWSTPTLELGTNEQGKATPKDFIPIADNATMDVVKGPQGLWMVVLAFRTCGLYTPPLLLRAKIETDDKAASGTLDVAKQKLNAAPDGLQYYYNFWLVVQNPELAGDKMATVTLKIEDAAGHTGEHTLRVKLQKQ